MIKTSQAIAAYNGRGKVEKEDLREAASYALPHRLRRMPFDDTPGDIDSILNKISEQIF